MGPDIFGWKEAATGAAALLCGVVAFTVNLFTGRLNKHEQEDRENFGKLFDGQDRVVEKISEGFRELDQKVSDMHIKLLERINDNNQRNNGG